MLKILPHPVLQVHGLADVYNLTAAVVHLVYARFVRQQF